MLIAKLQQEVQVKDEALKKAYEDMKFYKLELLNREENYNKMFGASPTVGVLNPINSKRATIKDTKVGTQRGSSSLARKASRLRD